MGRVYVYLAVPSVFSLVGPLSGLMDVSEFLPFLHSVLVVLSVQCRDLGLLGKVDSESEHG